MRSLRRISPVCTVHEGPCSKVLQCEALRMSPPSCRGCSTVVKYPGSALDASLFDSGPKLSKRRVRQMERRWGPLWRYHTGSEEGEKSVSLTSTQPPALALPAHSATPAMTSGEVRHRAIEVGLVDPMNIGSAGEKSNAPAVVSSANTAPSVSAAEDPLLVFMETNQEEAAVLLAMWSSLRRSCLFASEISESVSLRMRYLFHLMVRNRAFGAAVQFYNRLTSIGVQLHKSDLALLLASLPYEHASTEESRHRRWMEEDAEAEATRRKNAKKFAGEPHRQQQQMAETKGQGTEATPSAAHSSSPTDISSNTDSLRQTSPSTEDQTKTAPLSESFSSQPEWVKRWVLYEVSMGNLDWYGDESSGRSVHSALERRTDPNPPSLASAGAEDEGALLRTASHEAKQLMELTSLVEHLEVLSLGEMELESSVRKSKSFSKGGSFREAAKTSVAPHHLLRRLPRGRGRALWMEALQLSQVLLPSQRPPHTGQDSLATVDRLPKELRASLQRLARQSWSFPAALAICKLSGTCSLSDSALATLIATQKSDWHSNSNLEEVLHAVLGAGSTGKNQQEESLLVTCVAPCLEALWTAHLCHVKAIRPDELFQYLGEGAADPHSLDVGDAGSLASLVPQLLRRTISAATNLAVSANKSMRATALAGIVANRGREEDDERRPSGKEGGEGGKRTPELFSEDSMNLPGTGASRYLSEHQLAPTGIVDSFLLCAAVIRDVGLLLVAAEPALKISPTLQPCIHTQFVDSLFKSQFSLYSVFHFLYERNPFASLAARRRAAEKPLLATSVALTHLVVAEALLESRSKHDANPPRTDPLTTANLLFNQAWTLLEPLSTQQVRESALWRSATLAQIKLLVGVLPRVLQTLLRREGIGEHNERAVFAAIDEQAVQNLCLILKILVKVNDLRTAEGQEYGLRRLVSSNFPIRAQLTLRLCLHPATNLGRRVRLGLSKKEVELLDICFFRSRSRQSGSQINVKVTAATPGSGKPSSHSNPLIPVSQNVFKLVTNESSPARAASALEELASKARSWDEALLLYTAATSHVRLSSQLYTTGFFRALLDQMAADARQCREELRVLPHKVGRRHSSSHTQSCTAGTTGIPANLWLEAAQIFWSCVDHAGRAGRPRVHRQCGTASEERSAPPEKAVFGELLLPLLALAASMERQDVGRQWRRSWSRCFSPEEKLLPEYQQKNIEALCILRDAAALEQAVQFDGKFDGEGVLCKAVECSSNWVAALCALFAARGTPEEAAELRRPYSPEVARLIIVALSKCPTNLSNTAMKLQTLQEEYPDAWNVDCSIEVIHMLVKARRTRHALERVDSALKLKEVADLASSLCASPPFPLVVSYARLLTLGLQATAISGDASKGTHYYELFNALMARMELAGKCDPGGDTARRSEQDSVGKADGRLDQAASQDLGVEPTREVVEANDTASHLKELFSRGRLYYFRAVTKRGFE